MVDQYLIQAWETGMRTDVSLRAAWARDWPCLPTTHTHIPIAVTHSETYNIPTDSMMKEHFWTVGKVHSHYIETFCLLPIDMFCYPCNYEFMSSLVSQL